jgi:hypothetical protein
MGKETSIIATLALPENVIPAKAGIQASSPRKRGTSIWSTGFPRIKYGASLVKPGMTTRAGLLLSRDFYSRWSPLFQYSTLPLFRNSLWEVLE